MTDTKPMPVSCGWCGEELDGLDADHRCEEGARVFAAIASGDPEVLLDE